MDDDPIADMPDQFTEDQIKYCKDQLDITLWRKWLNEKTIEVRNKTSHHKMYRNSATLFVDG